MTRAINCASLTMALIGAVVLLCSCGGTAELLWYDPVRALMQSQSMGRCSSRCPSPLTCNSDTGLCERVLCEGRCGLAEWCDTSGASDRCVSSSRR